VRKEALNSLVFDPITVESTTYLKALTIYGAWFSMRPPGTLQHHDTSWMSKIEIIDPYSSPELLKFGWTLSPYQKIREGQNKSIVRRAMSQFLPAGVTTRSEKVGFDVPFSQWMTLSSFRNFFIDVLDSKAAEFLNETIDLPRVLAHIKDAAYPRLNPMFVWQAVNGTLWRMNMQTRRDT
jgi:asparagine synthetase B (glutamine-hydrolysing)